MAKGNHVFNNFSGIVQEAYKQILSTFQVHPGQPASVTYAAHLNALENKEGRAGNVALAREELENGKLSESYSKYRLIADHPLMNRIHEIQDDGRVLPNDPNSVAFSDAATLFKQAAMDWAMGVPDADPSVAWRQMVNVGFDQAAHDSYVSAASTAKARDDRKHECLEIRKFVSGDLTSKVFNWLLMLRVDLKKAKLAGYVGKGEDWKAVLKPPPSFVPATS